MEEDIKKIKRSFKLVSDYNFNLSGEEYYYEKYFKKRNRNKQQKWIIT